MIAPSLFLSPPAVTGGFLRPPSLGPPLRPPRPTGPWLRTGCVVPFLLATPTRSASLADSRRFPRNAGYTAGLCPTTWSGLSARPSLLWVSTPSLRAITPTPRGGARRPSLPLATLGLPPQNTESAPPRPLTPAAVRALLTTLQCSLYATAHKVACPPGLVRPGDFLRPPRTFTPELARGRSPGPRVGDHYTALLGENCGRTFTGWSAAVTGCTLFRKVYSNNLLSILYCGFVSSFFPHIAWLRKFAAERRTEKDDTQLSGNKKSEEN